MYVYGGVSVPCLIQAFKAVVNDTSVFRMELAASKNRYTHTHVHTYI